MRMHIELDDELVAKLDELAGPRGRSAFVRAALERAIRHESRRASIEAAAGAIDDENHAWDADPSAWVREQRHADDRRAG